MAVAAVTQSNFDEEVMQHKGVVLVDFYADWCGPCKMTAPIIDELSEEMKDVKFVKVNVDENQDIAGKYSIFSIPTFLIVKDGSVVNQFAGARGKEGFEEELNKVLSG